MIGKDFEDISLAMNRGNYDEGEASNIFITLVKDMVVTKFDDRDSSQIPETPPGPGRVVAGSVDDNGEETAGAADGQSAALVEAAVKHLDALRAALLEKK